MSFARNPQSHVIGAAKGVPSIVTFMHEQEIAQVIAEQDPFGLAHHCSNPAGHQPIASCGEIVCVHCARIFWR